MSDKKRIIEILILAAVFISSLLLVWNFFREEYGYERYENDSVSYIKGEVIEISEQELQLTGADNEYMTGFQRIVVRLENGENVEIEHFVTLTHNIIVKKGTKVIVLADQPEGVEAFYSIYNYDREPIVWGIVFSFMFLLFLVGRLKGIRSGLGLGFTLTIVVCYMIPGLYNGENPWWTIVVTILLASAGSCFCIGGFGRKTVCNIIDTSLGGMAAGGIYFILITMMKMNGGTLEAAEDLQLISQATGMTFQSVMFAGIMIGVLGAVMDVAVSMSAALWEVKEAAGIVSRKQLFAAGMNIGKDMIGTMTNTLILAFLGGSLPTLMVLISYGVQYQQFLSSNFLALELVQGIAGSAAVILTVPISAFVCSLVYTK